MYFFISERSKFYLGFCLSLLLSSSPYLWFVLLWRVILATVALTFICSFSITYVISESILSHWVFSWSWGIPSCFFVFHASKSCRGAHRVSVILCSPCPSVYHCTWPGHNYASWEVHLDTRLLATLCTSFEFHQLCKSGRCWTQLHSPGILGSVQFPVPVLQPGNSLQTENRGPHGPRGVMHLLQPQRDTVPRTCYSLGETQCLTPVWGRWSILRSTVRLPVASHSGPPGVEFYDQRLAPLYFKKKNESFTTSLLLYFPREEGRK